jgi:hypothetical protein
MVNLTVKNDNQAHIRGFSSVARITIFVVGLLTEVMLFFLVWYRLIADTLYAVASLSVLAVVLVSTYKLDKNAKRKLLE